MAQSDAGHTHAADLVWGPSPILLLSYQDLKMKQNGVTLKKKSIVLLQFINITDIG